MQIHAGIYLTAVSVGDVLELVAEHPGAFPRRIIKLESRLKVEVEIELRLAMDVHRNGADGRDKTRGRGSKKLKPAPAKEIQLQANWIYAAAIDYLARAGDINHVTGGVNEAPSNLGLQHDLHRIYIHRVFEGPFRFVNDHPAIAKSKNRELARAGDANEMRRTRGIGGPNAELIIAALETCLLRRRSLASTRG